MVSFFVVKAKIIDRFVWCLITSFVLLKYVWIKQGLLCQSKIFEKKFIVYMKIWKEIYIYFNFFFQCLILQKFIKWGVFSIHNTIDN
jgi:hypothetical protein